MLILNSIYFKYRFIFSMNQNIFFLFVLSGRTIFNLIEFELGFLDKLQYRNILLLSYTSTKEILRQIY